MRTTPRTISPKQPVAFPRTLSLASLIVAAALSAASIEAQQPRVPLSRADAIRSALTRGVRLPTAQADTLVAAAQLLTARALGNPTLTASYTKSVPQYHAELEVPLPFPWIRNPRVASARFGAAAARLRYSFARAAAALDADTSYTLALAATARTALSARTAADADSLLRMAIARRDAGDASDLDVELARVNAGQQANAAASDSLILRAALLDLQLAIGLAGDSVEAAPTDSLTAPPAADPGGGGARAGGRRAGAGPPREPDPDRPGRAGGGGGARPGRTRARGGRQREPGRGDVDDRLPRGRVDAA